MHKSILKSLLIGSMALVAAGFTGCDKYGDDIADLQGRADALEASVKELTSKIASGKWVSSVSTTADGYTLTLVDANGGTETVSVKNGAQGAAGEQGPAGVAPTIEIGENGNWFINGEDTGKPSTGKAGEAAKSPIFEDGELKVWDAEAGEYVGTGIKAKATTWIADMDTHYVLYTVDADGNATEVKLPKTAAITGVEVYKYDEGTNKLSEDAKVTFYTGGSYVDNYLVDSFTFNGKTYSYGTMLVSGSDKLIAQVNPLTVDLDKFYLSLVDSKGNVTVNVANAGVHKTIDAYTKADPTPNPGYYELELTVPSSNSYVEDAEKAALALQVYDPVTEAKTISDLNVSLEWVKNVSSAPANHEITLRVNRNHSLVGVIPADQYLVDYYFDMPENQTATKEELGVEFDPATQTISAAKAGSIALHMNYLQLDGHYYQGYSGTYKSTKYLTINFISEEISVIPDFEWTMTLGLKDSETMVIKEISKTVYDLFFKNGAIASGLFRTDYPNYSYRNTYATYTWHALKAGKTPTLKYAEDVFVGGIRKARANATADAYDLADGMQFYGAVQNDAQGYPKYYMLVDFGTITSTSKYYATTYKAELANTTSAGATTKYQFKINVNPVQAADFFKRNTELFNGNEAVAFGKANGTKVTYNLVDLYHNTMENWNHVSVTEKRWSYTNSTGGTSWSEAWIDNAIAGYRVWNSDDKTITVNAWKSSYNQGVYTSRDFILSYTPAGNTRLNTVDDAFTLTVKSEDKEGSMTYIKRTPVEDAPDKIEAGQAKIIATPDGVMLNVAKEILVKNVFNQNITAERVADMQVRVANDKAKQYILIDNNPGVNSANKAIPYPVGPDNEVTFTANYPTTGFAEDVQCEITVFFIDAWGVENAVNVPITIQKTN